MREEESGKKKTYPTTSMQAPAQKYDGRFISSLWESNRERTIQGEVLKFMANFRQPGVHGFELYKSLCVVFNGKHAPRLLGVTRYSA
jgi:hypothetical protein